MPGVMGAQREGFSVEIMAIFQLDCHISSLVPFQTSQGSTSSPSSFLVLAFLPPHSDLDSESSSDEDGERPPAPLKRIPSQRPELRIISRQGEELSSDALTLTGYDQWGCNDYWLVPALLGSMPSPSPAAEDSNGGRTDGKPPSMGYVVLSPKEIVLAKERGTKDHITWLVERRRYQEALDQAEQLTEDERNEEGEISVRGIGEKFLRSLVESCELF